jgi:uncharacterized protein (DUF58 family)
MYPVLFRAARRLARNRPLWLTRLDEWEEHDWTGARHFVAAMAWLTVAMFFSLNGAAAFDRGERGLAAVCHTFALGVAFYVSVKIVPAMARTTALRWLFYQVDYSLTKQGGVYLVAIFIIALAALNTGNNMLFIILASLIAGILISGVVSRMVLTGVELELELPDHLFARQPVLASLTLENLKLTLPSFSLTVSGDAADDKSAKKKKKAAPPRRVLPEPVYFPYIPRAQEATQQVELTFPRRGRYTQDAFAVSSQFPFGFLLKTRKVSCATDVIVYPPVEPTEEFYEILPLISGEMESYYRGRGHDLYTIRDHQPGDGARYVDWKASAKAQALKVREFTREDERRVDLVFDPYLPPAARGSDWDERFERAVNFCACLAWHFYEINAQMRYRSPDGDTPMAPASEIVYDILRHLALVEPRRKSDERFLEHLAAETDTFKIILTARPRGTIPTPLWTSAYLVFVDSLG